MPSKTSKKKAAVALPTIPKELIDQLVSGPMSAEAINTASMAFKKALIERARERCPCSKRFRTTVTLPTTVASATN